MRARESGMPEESVWSGFFQPGEVLRRLGLEPNGGDVADFGCGYGTFTIPAAGLVRGVVHAFDIDPEMAAATNARAGAEGFDNVRASVRDLFSDGSGLPDGSVGFAMVFNIVHCEHPDTLLREAWRVLSPGGTLAVMHWKYDASTPRGPSMEIRPRPEQCRAWAVDAGFTPRGEDVIDLPPFHYGMSFMKPIDNLSQLPLLDHPLGSPSVFRPDELIRAVQDQRRIEGSALPEVCVLDFDGDLTDDLVNSGEAHRCEAWACFHTSMWTVDIDGRRSGLIARTIGGPYAVLVAEQLAVSGVRVVIGLTSAGRVGSQLPVPGVVVADRAIRDEGTSYHYLPPNESVDANSAVADALEFEMRAVGLPMKRGLVWTTDAPYRETAEQIRRYDLKGALAVEMQAASLFAFGAARGVAVGVAAHVTNAPDHDGELFNKGSANLQRALLHAACRAGHRFLRGIGIS